MNSAEDYAQEFSSEVFFFLVGTFAVFSEYAGRGSVPLPPLRPAKPRGVTAPGLSRFRSLSSLPRLQQPDPQLSPGPTSLCIAFPDAEGLSVGDGSFYRPQQAARRVCAA